MNIIEAVLKNKETGLFIRRTSWANPHCWITHGEEGDDGFRFIGDDKSIADTSHSLAGFDQNDILGDDWQLKEVE